MRKKQENKNNDDDNKKKKEKRNAGKNTINNIFKNKYNSGTGNN